MDAPFADTLLKLMAAWLLLAGAALWARQAKLGLSRRMLIASLRGLLQLLALAFVLHWIFDIESPLVQMAIIGVFCLLAGHNSAGHLDESRSAWLACSTALVCACLVTLPWLVLSDTIAADTRTLIPLGSMIAANGMNAVSIMFERLRSGGAAGENLHTAMIPSIDILRVAGLVHMPGIFVGMILAGAEPMAAASAQLIILYMIVTSSFTACMVTMLTLNHLRKRVPN